MTTFGCAGCGGVWGVGVWGRMCVCVCVCGGGGGGGGGGGNVYKLLNLRAQCKNLRFQCSIKIISFNAWVRLLCGISL